MDEAKPLTPEVYARGKGKILTAFGMRLPEALKVIHEFYSEQRAKRSDVPLINHIHEGLAILDAIDAPDRVKDAFCIHPIIQTGHADFLQAYPNAGLKKAIRMAEMYTRIANAYLCRPDTDHITTVEALEKHLPEVPVSTAQMLYADKIQNRKDFRLYHARTHPRRRELTRYFDLWIEFLRTKCLNVAAAVNHPRDTL